MNRGFSRRDAMRAVGSSMLVSIVPLAAAFPSDADTAAVISELYGEREFRAGRIALKLPPLAETGNSVPLSLSVDSPMSDRDRVCLASITNSGASKPLKGVHISFAGYSLSENHLASSASGSLGSSAAAWSHTARKHVAAAPVRDLRPE